LRRLAIIKIGHRAAAPETGDAAQLLLGLSRLLQEWIKLLSYSWSLSGFQVDQGVGRATQLLLMPVMLCQAAQLLLDLIRLNTDYGVSQAAQLFLELARLLGCS
jgi:hypothetical protein